MKLKLEGCSNPGFTFTEVRKAQIIEFYEWIKAHSEEEEKTYKQIQDEIASSSQNLDGSKIRMFVPFLRKVGYINNDGFEKKNAAMELKGFFSQEGKAFIEYLKLSKQITVLNMDDVNSKMFEIGNLFDIISIINLASNDESNIYIECIKFLKRYENMDKNEFYLMTTLREKYTGEEYIKKLDKAIMKYRKGAFKRIEIIKHENAFGYIKAFLVETHVVIQENSKLKLNAKYSHVFNGI
ncbi:hypothetical protein COL11_08195 [Bacillus anthracis]|uniref:Uncharacterized protein n=1 Tax=Bacillus thuringiensis serovar sooncheon TaxID=180891 RepID=A0A9Q5SG17_BACTU|nr:hypothetical protein [Bacillus thuringiensis]PFW37355.1 hypothetical protein COL11_08195 [Bacillus anthracis]OTW67563.1 hypothetical protein BK707_20565 [Bacillus thuringiensis serovar coreanensis]OTX44180.1 hypothetical protein BK724_15860 [Bacillus thuringiensis serovar sooncheon]OTX53343.1 hypothetical protein BK725_14245 [Bacillus thuringiensis serovar guiyangiensis]OTX67664.1 hypothetical protein BK727_15265 [Bacillus thuringiensis serovar roskildiensis]